ncbi:MAG: hypothetical protein U5R49_26140 [Deltaproteobacteria bacterium]|nr:hypothetical protein [Deltaproteobacteria bacterium]
MFNDFSVKTNEGSYDIEARVMRIGGDVLVAVYGGEKPHIGAVAVAQPRASLRDASRISSTASVFCRVGHKEDDLAKATAEVLSAALNTPVVVTAGIHWDDLDETGIQTVIQNSRLLVEMILDTLAKED